MKIKTIIAILVLTVTPGLASAMCSDDDHAKANMSCAEGKVFDSKLMTCVPVSG